MDIKQLKRIIKEFEESSIHKLEITEKDFTVKLEKKPEPAFSVNPNQVNQAMDYESNNNIEMKQDINNNVFVKAPLVGTFYDSPSPESDSFVSINQKVNKGDTLFIVEAMKVMNEITAPVSGVIKMIHIQSGTMVEYGQVIMEIEE
ncbi:acetyl-CoA carboxylase biotin carboxyl carrier protein [Candidatus Izemoplasma sp. B36]|uniref:acetyl-CoA carboxylase biotin carboxyl carrier protein n=1 Tax=Candidatus Izemoplasma sp. B36 TaxID=3242468 RepID=UPI0035589F2C